MATLRTDSPDAAPEATPPPRGGASRTVKHVLDRLAAAFALLVASPLLAGIALTLWWGSRPVLRREERIGEGGRRVVVRSFAITEELQNARGWRLLARSGAAALPQLWNILRGEMSLVGPRPRPHGLEAPPARPGLTGLAQLHQLDRWLSVAEQLALDDEYAREWSLGLDARIVRRTIARAFR